MQCSARTPNWIAGPCYPAVGMATAVRRSGFPGAGAASPGGLWARAREKVAIGMPMNGAGLCAGRISETRSPGRGGSHPEFPFDYGIVPGGAPGEPGSRTGDRAAEKMTAAAIRTTICVSELTYFGAAVRDCTEMALREFTLVPGSHDVFPAASRSPDSGMKSRSRARNRMSQANVVNGCRNRGWCRVGDRGAKPWAEPGAGASAATAAKEGTA